MSHRFKSHRNPLHPISRKRGESQEDSRLRHYAAMITDQEQLNSFMAGVRPDMRAACLERIKPFLRFKLASQELKETQCPHCQIIIGFQHPDDFSACPDCGNALTYPLKPLEKEIAIV